jgi:hypothetical protein
MIISFVMHKRKRERTSEIVSLSLSLTQRKRHRVCAVLASGSCHSSPGRVRVQEQNMPRAQIGVDNGTGENKPI